MENTLSVRFGSRGAVILSAQRESASALAAWRTVAPPDGKLPAAATPIQRLMYTRMMTSVFVFNMARMRARQHYLESVCAAPAPLQNGSTRLRRDVFVGELQHLVDDPQPEAQIVL